MGIPREVRAVARVLDRGVHPSRIDKGNHSRDGEKLTHRNGWHKLAACGTPHYLHKPSGYAIVLGKRKTAAIINPPQMGALPTLMVGYFRVMDDQNKPFGRVPTSLFQRLATTPDDQERGLDNDCLKRLIDPEADSLTDEQQEAINQMVEAFGSEPA